MERGRFSESNTERKSGFKLPKGEMVGNEKRGETVRQRKLRNEREKTVKGAEGERGDAIKR